MASTQNSFRYQHLLNKQIYNIGFRTFSFLESFLKDRRQTHFFSSAPKSKKEMIDIKSYLSILTHSMNPDNELEVGKVLRKTNEKPEIAIFNSFSAEQMFRY